MKTNLLKTVMIMVTLSLPLMNFAQWNVNNVWNDKWGRTNDPPLTLNDIRRIGVGNFTNYGGPKAALHVNENLLTDLDPNIASNYYTPGHLFRTDGPLDQDNMWQLFTGPDASATEKGRFYVPKNEGDFYITSFLNPTGSSLDMDGALLLNSHVPLNTTPEGNRMIISRSPLSGYTQIGISINQTIPIKNRMVSTLNMGNNLNSTIGNDNGARTWMNVGTFCYRSTDNMYVGLKESAPDRDNAVINWGDNSTNQYNYGPDNLLFIFTSELASGPGFGPSYTENGVEIARMTYDYEIPRMGISENNPKARLHINTQGLGTLMTNEDKKLQLRIADGYGYSDFRAFSNGDLLINPVFEDYMSTPSTITPKDAGIGVLKPNHPNAKLEVLRNDYQQLRLTNTYNQTYTDFYTTTVGNQLINPYNGTSKKDVGIGLLNSQGEYPEAKLEVNRADYQQLRLTNKWHSIYTDFYTSSIGDMLINPTHFQVGINIDVANPNQPDRELDVNGNGRFRTLPNAQNDTLTKVVVVDDDGHLFHRDASTLVGGLGDADWYDPITGIAPTNINSDIYTMGNVAIDATSAPNVKLFIANQDRDYGVVLKQTGISNNNIFGIYSSVNATPSNIGHNDYVCSICGYGTGNDNSAYQTGFVCGVFGNAMSGKTNCGIVGYAKNNTNGVNFGGFFEANNGGGNYGIYAQAGPSSGVTPPTGPNYAGYFVGDVYITGTFGPSDQMLKQNIVTIQNASDIIMQLNPVNFNFRTNDYPYLHLSTSNQMGLIAQEVEPILPNLVKETIHPAQYDSLGNEISPELSFKSLDYDKFIPLLIANAKEQQNEIDSLENILSSYQTQFAMLDSLLQVVNNISNNYSSNSNQNNMIKNFEIVYKSYNENENTILYQNTPNPFKEITEFSYYLSNNGEVVFEIHDQYGKLIQVLANEQQSEGKHIINWDSNNLESGVYYYSLKVNGETLVKKAIKIK